MDPELPSKLIDASSALFSMNTQLQKVGTQPEPLPLRRSVPGKISPIGEFTHEGRPSDAGLGFSNERFQSELAGHGAVHVPLCDEEALFARSSRLDGRSPVILRR